MAICPKCGSWVDEGDICMNCSGGSSVGGFELVNPSQKAKAQKLGKEAWKFYMDYDDDEALILINRALNYDARNSSNWNRKAIILESMGRYEDSIECYDRAIALRKSNVFIDNKARMIKDWVIYLLDYEIQLKLAESLLKEAISDISSIPTEENVDEYRNLLKRVQSKI